MRRLTLLLFCFMLSHQTLAQTTANALQKLATDYVKSQAPTSITDLTIKVRPPSSRLKLPDCPAVSMSFQDSKHLFGQKTLRVSCAKPYWHIYLQVTISGKLPVVVAKQDILQGSALDQTNLAIQLQETTALTRPYFTSVQQLSSARAKTYIAKGHRLEPIMLEQQYLVPKGKAVMIVSQISGIHVKAKGVALEPGMKGDNIRVQNSHSKKTVHATIQNAREVIV